ncbi:MAG: SMP-30/gluconolactonase/LRE family protein [Pseudomonadota bacterium]
MKKRYWAGTVLAVVAGYLLFAPTAIEPVSWTPPVAPSLTEGEFKENSRLAGIERFGTDLELHGPEAVLADAQQRILTGLQDGRIVRLSADGKSLETLTNTGGRPLGLAWHPDGRLIIADGIKGLLALNVQSGDLKVLATESDGVPFGFADDVDISADGQYAYFSDASIRWHYGEDSQAVMEHRGDGRLLVYDFKNGETKALVGGLEFANGVALGPNEDYVLVAETGAYRISRLWLKGEKAGRQDVFRDNLPGLPDNITFNGKDRFWVAIFTPRNIFLDVFADKPFMRKVIARALTVIPKIVEHRAMVLGLDANGRVVANLQDSSSGNYSPITSVREIGNHLYLGSLTQNSLAKIALTP